MTIYHQFTQDDITYFIINKFNKETPYFLGNVYITLSDENVPMTNLCPLMECSKCSLRAICHTKNTANRTKTAFNLFPSILTNFPELGV